MHAIFGIFLYLASYWCHIFLHLRSPSWSTHARDTENVEYWVESESFSTTSGSRGKTSGVMDRPWNGACREAVNCAFFRKSSRNRLRSKRNCFNVDTFDSTRYRARRSPGLTFSCTKRLRMREQNSRRIGRWNTLTGRRSAWLTSNLQLWIHSTACEAAKRLSQCQKGVEVRGEMLPGPELEDWCQCNLLSRTSGSDWPACRRRSRRAVYCCIDRSVYLLPQCSYPVEEGVGAVGW